MESPPGADIVDEYLQPCDMLRATQRPLVTYLQV